MPGTQFKSYADGLYVGDAPTGPFRLVPSSPFSHKPTGFAAGAGHSSTFTQPGGGGDLWHVSTITISVRHMFERPCLTLTLTLTPTPTPTPTPIRTRCVTCSSGGSASTHSRTTPPAVPSWLTNPDPDPNPNPNPNPDPNLNPNPDQAPSWPRPTWATTRSPCPGCAGPAPSRS